jgi:CheY-like chemotaxis protein
MGNASPFAVLVVDDNPVERTLICSYLEALGIFADSAAHGREALDACRTRSYDLIFMDSRMPIMDGAAAVREIRAAEADTGRRARIVGMTDRPGEATRPVEGADIGLSKPLEAHMVREQVEIVRRQQEA